MKAGEKKYWTPEREKAILKLGKKAAACSKSTYKDWQLARESLPKESTILKDRTNEQLRKIYSRIVKSSQGICTYGSCKKPALKNHLYCEGHRVYMAEKALKHFNNGGGCGGR